MKVAENNITTEQVEQAVRMLQAIGLGEAAAGCYLVLVYRLPRALRSSHIQEEIVITKSTLFRALKELQTKGFITVYEGPLHKSYKAEPLSFALDNYALHQREIVQPLLKVLHNSPLSGTIFN